MQTAKWRTAQDKDWEIKSFDKIKNRRMKFVTSSEYIGLENLGCTWYMNSVLQQLYMIVPFRMAIQSVKNQRENDTKEFDTLYHTKLLFASLSNAGTTYHNPEHFFKTIKDIDGSDLNPLEQRDADEFLARFFDIIEPQIKNTKEEKKIGNIFHGSFANQNICIDWPHKSEIIENFTTISLQVKNKHSLEESLDSFIESEILQGDNAYYCDKWEKKVSCRRRTWIKKLPNIMVIALKRFEINYETMQHSKINDRVSFPIEIKMDKYTDKQLEKTDLLKQMEEMNWSYEDLTEDKKRIYDFEYPEEYYNYNLRGIVVHMGEANSGHYFSYIKDTRTGEWYEFNDTNVMPFDTADMDEKAFGGEYGDDKQKYSRFRNIGFKPYNAYLLLYERNFYIETNDFMDKVDTPGEDLNAFFNIRFSRLESTVINLNLHDEEVGNVVSNHNEALWESKQLFSNSFARLCFQISNNYSYDKAGKDIMREVRSINLHDFERLPKSSKVKWISTFHRQAITILYFMTVILRSSSKPYFSEYWSTIRHSLTNYYPIAFFFIENFWKTDILQEFITLRKLSVLRMMVPYFIKLACKKVYQEEEDMITQYCNLCEENPDSPEKVAKKSKGNSKVEILYETVKIWDHNDRIKEIEEWTVYVYDNNNDIPILVVFANKLLKLAREFYENIQLTQKYHALSNFLELFYHVADSGPEMKRYMIKNKFIGRLLDIYNYKNSVNKHYFRDLSYLPTYEKSWNEHIDSRSTKNIKDENESDDISNEEVDFGLRYIKQRQNKDDLVVEKEKKGKEAKKSDDDDYSDLAVLRGNKEGDDKRFAYLLRTISLLVCSCKFKLSGNFIAADSCFLNNPVPFTVPDSEERVMNELCSEDMMNDLIIRNTFNVSAKEDINTMYAHLCWENDDVSDRLLKLLVSDIWNPDSVFVTIIRHTPLIVNIAKIKDRLSETRMVYLIQNLFEKSFINDYRTYIKDSDSILNTILMIVRVNYDACSYMRGLDEPMKHIQKFFDKNPIPRAYSSSQVLFRGISGNEKIERYLSDDDKKTLNNYAEYRLQLFKDLLEDEDWEKRIKEFIKREQPDFDKDNIYSKGEHLDYYKDEYKYWIEAQVIEDFGPIMQVSYKIPPSIVYIERGDDRKSSVKINKDSVRSAGVYTGDMYYQINGLYEFIYNKIWEKERSYRAGYRR